MVVRQTLHLFAAHADLDFDLGLSVDLFVRESNDLAIGLYESLGYIIYRRVKDYYGGGPKGKDEDGFGGFRILVRSAALQLT